MTPLFQVKRVSTIQKEHWGKNLLQKQVNIGSSKGTELQNAASRHIIHSALSIQVQRAASNQELFYFISWKQFLLFDLI